MVACFGIASCSCTRPVPITANTITSGEVLTTNEPVKPAITIEPDYTPPERLGSNDPDPDRAATVAPPSGTSPPVASPPVASPDVCDADALMDKGREEMIAGKYAAALITFELVYRCRPAQSLLFPIMALNACKSGNAAKAKRYYPKVRPRLQGRIAEECLTSKTAYE